MYEYNSMNPLSYYNCGIDHRKRKINVIRSNNKMTPNIVDVPSAPTELDSRDGLKENMNGRPPVPIEEGNYKLIIFQSSLNLLAHILIGAVVGITLIYSFASGLPLNPTQLHIVLCVIGYQLLMAEAILSLSPHNTWSWSMKLVHKRRAHWILQLAGSVLAIVGSFVKIIDKSVHWNTLHGKFALVALVFTTFSLVNGVASLWAFEMRRFIPGNLSKLTHICFGTIAFSTASIALCYGFDKNMFRFWLNEEIAYTVISFTAILTFIIIVNPVITFFNKTISIVKK